MDKCPVCGAELQIWYSLGGKKILGCSRIICEYKGKEINEKEVVDVKKVGIDEWLS